jgi:hypothetical protein
LTLNYDSILSTTFFAVRRELYDTIFKDNVVWNVMHSKGRKRLQNGGERIQIPLQYATNTTVGSYSGYELLDTTPQDNVTSAFYTWKQLSGSVSINRLEERQNSGESQILNLLRQKVTELSMSMQDEASRQLLVPNGSASGQTFTVGNSGKDLLGLPIIIADDPTTGTVGNLNRATYSWWRNQQTDSTASTFKGYKKELRTMWNDCSKGTGSGPDIALGDQTAYETYEAALDDNTRYTNTVMADMGFDNLRLKGSLFYWDERVPDWAGQKYPAVDGGVPLKSSVAFLNTKYLELVVDSQTDFITTPFVRPENQDARTAQVLFMGELCCSNMRKQGVLADISQSIVS